MSSRHWDDEIWALSMMIHSAWTLASRRSEFMGTEPKMCETNTWRSSVVKCFRWHRWIRVVDLDSAGTFSPRGARCFTTISVHLNASLLQTHGSSRVNKQLSILRHLFPYDISFLTTWQLFYRDFGASNRSSQCHPPVFDIPSHLDFTILQRQRAYDDDNRPKNENRVKY